MFVCWAVVGADKWISGRLSGRTVGTDCWPAQLILLPALRQVSAAGAAAGRLHLSGHLLLASGLDQTASLLLALLLLRRRVQLSSQASCGPDPLRRGRAEEAQQVAAGGPTRKVWRQSFATSQLQQLLAITRAKSSDNPFNKWHCLGGAHLLLSGGRRACCPVK